MYFKCPEQDSVEVIKTGHCLLNQTKAMPSVSYVYEMSRVRH